MLDRSTGQARDVSTLSGGESFLASLALALGLSDAVQSQSGQIRMDAMFIDEGFGSLDENALRSSIDVLLELADGKRLIGIISHVQELEERIDKQIVVTKNAERLDGQDERLKKFEKKPLKSRAHTSIYLTGGERLMEAQTKTKRQKY